LTSDIGKILSALHSIKATGKNDFLTSVQIAQVTKGMIDRGGMYVTIY
jgi:hypothetical protein